MGGSPKQVGTSTNLQGNQTDLLNRLIAELGGPAIESLGTLVQPQSAEERQALFQQSYVDPALQALRQDILPQIQQNFSNLNAGSSSALNNALSRAAQETATRIGSQAGQFSQNQQQLQLSALAQALGYGLNQYGEAIIKKPITSDLIGAAGTLGGAYLSTL